MKLYQYQKIFLNLLIYYLLILYKNAYYFRLTTN